jgi:transposase
VSESDEILYLKKLVSELLLKIEEQSAEILVLKARLSQNSSNSSRPPSSDGYRKKSYADIVNEGVEKKKRGGQPGHKGNTLHQFSHPDFVIEHKPETCACGHCFDNASGYDLSEKRQVFDIPPQRIDVYEHQVYQAKCPVCGQKHKAAFPPDVTAPAQYGNRMKTFVAVLNVVCSVPVAKTSRLVEDLYGVSLNEGTVISFCKQLSDKLEDTEKILQQHIANSDVVNADGY